jgi:hypothetical protein
MIPENISSTLDSPDQGAKGIPTESTAINGDSILIKIPVMCKDFTPVKYFMMK